MMSLYQSLKGRLFGVQVGLRVWGTFGALESRVQESVLSGL